MNQTDIAIATMTWARTEQEDRLLREAMRSLAVKDIPVVITDGGSSREFIDYLRRFPRFQISEANKAGVLVQVRSSLQTAYDLDTRFILYTEPDKKQFFEDKLDGFISGAASEDQIGVILASRSEASFATFPEFQRYTETAINRVCAEIIGEHLDYSYGPFLLNRRLIPYVDFIKEDIGWGWRPFLFGVAHRLGYRVLHMTDDFPCPPEQREDSRSERIYRMRQLSQSIQGLILSTTISTHDTSQPVEADR